MRYEIVAKKGLSAAEVLIDGKLRMESRQLKAHGDEVAEVVQAAMMFLKNEDVTWIQEWDCGIRAQADTDGAEIHYYVGGEYNPLDQNDLADYGDWDDVDRTAIFVVPQSMDDVNAETNCASLAGAVSIVSADPNQYHLVRRYWSAVFPFWPRLDEADLEVESFAEVEVLVRIFTETAYRWQRGL